MQHVVCAAGRVVQVDDLVVIGSQAVLGTFPDYELPNEATRSVEVDVAVDPELARLDLAADTTTLADLIDGSIGELSHFHQVNGYYAQGVEVTTAVLVEGWRDRLVPMVCEDERGHVVAWCLGVNDVWVAKAAAGREKDVEFCRALAEKGLVERDLCSHLIATLTGRHREGAKRVFNGAFRIEAADRESPAPRRRSGDA